ncbi:MAG: ketoacid-CoA transferase [Ottowia sp.]|uniref:CoA-transferase subunit beta n=1 Tax=Ottowia sp. TaxID=1898956 RepID=UPI0039E6DA54
MSTPENHSISEHMIAAIVAVIEDGDVLLEGIGTFLPTSAYMLAQATKAPRSIRLCPVGNCFVPNAHALSLAAYEFEALQHAVYRFTYWDVNGSYLPSFVTGRRGGWKEFLRPAQVDATGRTNNVVIGPYDRPRVRLPGAAGLPDGAPVEAALYMYVPRHDRNCFVPRLDFVSTPGMEEGGKPHTIVTDLAVMRFRPGGVLEVQTLMPGATREQVQDQTGFDLRFREQLLPLSPLTAQQLDVLRTRVDPLALRDLELFSGEARLARIEELARQEPVRAQLMERLVALAS